MAKFICIQETRLNESNHFAAKLELYLSYFSSFSCPLATYGRILVYCHRYYPVLVDCRTFVSAAIRRIWRHPDVHDAGHAGVDDAASHDVLEYLKK
jgi:hypothetical protein